ncbi:PGF-pre-PGF domain-containing protein [Methanococcoides sp. FTZ1]|uniref:PGF-pre-PGF domain-containing protein n=1 Tax=Methanococcoides sp. FTZ1 TaxID=3439061 RepID=UPI003F846482
MFCSLALNSASAEPVIAVDLPANNAEYTTNEVSLNVTGDGTVDTWWYSLNGSSNVTFTPNITLPVLPDGTHNLRVYASDSLGNEVSSSLISFSIDTTSPVITVDLPANNAEYTTNEVSLNVTGDGTVDTWWYSLNGSSNVTFTPNITLPVLPDGTHNLRVYASDSLGNEVSSSLISFSIDTTSPVITVDLPANNAEYTTNEVSLNVTGDGTVDTWWYSLNGSSNVTFTPNITLPVLPDGTHNLRVYASDSLGNEVSSSLISFSIDTTSPVITVDLPANNAEYTTNEVSLNVTGDGTVDTWWYSLNGSSNVTFTPNITLPVLPDGTHNLRVYASDSLGNEVSSSLISFSIDTTSPVITVDLPANNAEYTTNEVSLNVTGDGTVDTWWYSLNGSSNVTFTPNITLPVLPDGTHNLRVYASDSLGNEVSSSLISFSIDTTSPVITVDLPANNAEYTTNEVSLNVTGDGTVDTWWYSLNGSSNVTFTPNITLPVLPDGTHNLRVYASDSLGNEVSSSLISFSIDTTSPVITVDLPANNAEYTTNEVSLNVTGDGTVDTWWYSLNGSSNVTFTPNITLPVLPDGTHNLRVYASDSLGNEVSSSLISFSIDTTSPVITVDLPANNAEYTTNEVSLNVTGDGTVDTWWYSLNGSSNVTFTPNITLPVLPDGTHNLRVYASDSLGNEVSSSLISFSIDTTSPVITVDLPANNAEYTTNEVSLNVTGDGTVDTWWYSLNGSSNVTFTPNITLPVLPDGTHNLRVYASDSLGNEVSSSLISFSIDTTSPVITVDLPANNAEYTTNEVSLNVTGDGTVDTWWYSLNGSSNVTFTPNITLPVLPDGTHNLRVYASDSLGNEVSSSLISFSIDTTSPVITVDLPANNAEYTTNEVSLNVTGDGTVDTWWYSLNGSSNVTFTPNITLPVLPDGTHNLRVYASDSLGNEVSSSLISFSIDTTSPVITVDLPANNAEYTTNEVSLNVTGDGTVDTWWYSLNGSSNVTFTPNITLPVLPDGTHNLRVYASDSLGNEVSSSLISFSIDTTSPVITVDLPANNAEYTTNEVSLNVTGDDTVDTWWYSLNGSSNVTFTPNITLPVLPDGTHNLRVYASDSLGNEVSSSLISFSIDTTSPADIANLMVEERTTSSITLSWNNSSDTHHVELWRNNVHLIDVFNITYADTGLPSRTSYNYGLRPVDVLGNKGNWSNITASTQSSGGGSSSSAGGGGGSGSTGESYDNIAFKDVKSESIVGGLVISYVFDGDDRNPIHYINFSAVRNYPRTSTTIEVLKDMSEMVDESAPGEIYRYINIWVGKSAFATEDNIADPVIGFSVAKEWLTENGINEDSIVIYRHNSGRWNALNVEKIGEDNSYVYFEAETPGFSPFAIATDVDDEEVADIVPIEEGTGTIIITEPSGDDMNETDSEDGSVFGLNVLFFTIPALMLIGVLYASYSAKNKSDDAEFIPKDHSDGLQGAEGDVSGASLDVAVVEDVSGESDEITSTDLNDSGEFAEIASADLDDSGESDEISPIVEDASGDDSESIPAVEDVLGEQSEVTPAIEDLSVEPAEIIPAAEKVSDKPTEKASSDHNDKIQEPDIDQMLKSVNDIGKLLRAMREAEKGSDEVQSAVGVVSKEISDSTNDQQTEEKKESKKHDDSKW